MAYPSDMPMDMPDPGYVIYRETPNDLTAPPVFFPAKDSDELFDALRAKYPFVKTHSERMRDAIIEFLLEERQAEMAQASPAMPVETTTTSPWPQSWPSMSSGSGSIFSSPVTPDLATPAFVNSPQLQLPHLTRHTSTADSTTAKMSEASMTPPALEQMTGVFSLTATQPKQRVRRKMTETEKVEYRKRRIVKACDKCAKRKRKCHHNEVEMDSLAVKSQKISKSRTQSSATKLSSTTPAPQQQDALLDLAAFEFEDPFAADMQLFDDFTNVFDESVSGFVFDDSKPIDHWLDSETGVRTVTHGVSGGSKPAGVIQERGVGHAKAVDSGIGSMAHDGVAGVLEGPQRQLTWGGYHHELVTESEGTSSINNAQVTPDNNMIIKTGYHPHHLYSTINTLGEEGKGPETGDQQLQLDGMVHGDSPCTAQAPTHTAHAHDLECQGAYVFDNAGRTGTGCAGPQHRSLVQTVSRLLGTQKAISVLGNLLHSRPICSGRSVSLGRVAEVIRLRAIIRTDQSPLLQEADVPAPVVVPQNGWYGKHGHGDTPRPDPKLDTDPSNHVHQSETGALGPLEGMSIDDYLRMKANFFQVEKSGRSSSTAPAVIKRTQKKFGYPPVVVDDAGVPKTQGMLASTSVPAPSRCPLPGSGESAGREGRPSQRVLGGSITRVESPSTELYRLRKRVTRPICHNVSGDGQRLWARTATSQASRPMEDSQARFSANADSPAQSQTGNHRSNGFSWDLHRQSLSLAGTAGTAAVSSFSSPTSNSSATICAVTEYRLSDHFRRRDHFGRSEDKSNQQFAAVLAVIGALLLLTALSNTAPSVNTTLLLLAMFSPLPGAKGCHSRARAWRFWSQLNLSTMLECTIKNTSWLGQLRTKIMGPLVHQQQQQQEAWKCESLFDVASSKTPSGNIGQVAEVA